MTVYYNEIEPYAASWLRNLIKAGLIPDGDVDERDIRDVTPRELMGYTQCHFFAGIGGWAYALRLAGWGDDRRVWTGSCPCQSFSAAGRGKGFADERHLWPYWFHLIEVCRPSVIFGEEVASKAALEWLDLVSADLEDAGYAVGAADLCAAGVGAPHIRQRLYWMADSGLPERTGCEHPEGGGEGQSCDEPAPYGCSGGLASSQHLLKHRNSGTIGSLGGFWADAAWIPCTDGKARPTQSGLFPLAHGIAGRMGRLRAYGNSLVAPCAAAFVKAVMDCLP